MYAPQSVVSRIYRNADTTDCKLRKISDEGRWHPRKSYSCTYDLYGPVRNVFDAYRQIHYKGKGGGGGPGNREFFGPCEMA